jgi:hypothetical protein
MLMLIGAQAAFAYTAEECIECHRQGSAKSRLHVAIEDYQSSVHGRQGMGCTDCHKALDESGHQPGKGGSAPSSRSAPVSCTDCHSQENRHGSGSTGSTGSADPAGSTGSDSRPRCFSCHTKHSILEKENSASSIHPESLKRTCSTCHPVECGKSDYLSWLPTLQIVSHGKQDFSRAYARDNCIGCHQGMAAHGETESIDTQNCRKCHQSMMGYMHPRADREKEPDVFAAAIIYQVFFAALLLGGCGFYFLRGRR